MTKSPRARLESINKLVEEKLKLRLLEIAKTAVNLSPVDTGAYITSFSYAVGPGRPRGKSSKNKATGQSKQQMEEEGFDGLKSDVNRITDLTNTAAISLRNNSPHALDVEYGENWFKTDGYFVFTKLRNIYG